MGVRVLAERRQDQRRVEAEFKAQEGVPAVDLPDKDRMLDALTKEFRAVRWAAEHARCGVVVWEAFPPHAARPPCRFKFLEGLHQQMGYWLAKSQFRNHKLTLLDAFYTALAFTSTQGIDEWLLMGRGTSVIVSTLPGFVYAGEHVRVCNDISYLGMLDRRVRVYLDNALPPDVWYTGHHHFASKGLCNHLPCSFAEPPSP